MASRSISLMNVMRQTNVSQENIGNLFEMPKRNVFSQGESDGNGFPRTCDLFVPNDKSQPKIVLEDWSDEEYYKLNGNYLEDLAGTGLHRLIENHPACMKINGTAISKHLNIFNYPKALKDKCFIIQVIFSDSYTNQVESREIHLENVCPYVIKYNFKSISNYDNANLPIKLPPVGEQVFYFDIRPNMLLPGEKRIFQIEFVSKLTGCYKEEWELLTVPPIHTKQIIVNFRAVAKEKKMEEPWKQLDVYLNRSISNDISRVILEHLIRKVFQNPVSTKVVHPLNLNTEEEIFLFIQNNSYSYDEKVVSYLNELYLQLFNENWNLNISNFEEKLTQSPGLKKELDEFIKLKIKLVKSDETLMPRSYYEKYTQIFNILGDAVNDLQAIVDLFRVKYGLKNLPPIPAPDEAPPYFYFPEPVSLLPEVEIPGKGKKGAATAPKAAKKPPKKREFMPLIPQERFVLKPMEWKPENEEYASDVLEQVQSRLLIAMSDIEKALKDDGDMTSQSTTHQALISRKSY